MFSSRCRQIGRLFSAILFELQPFRLTDCFVFLRTIFYEGSHAFQYSWKGAIFITESIFITLYRFIFNLSPIIRLFGLLYFLIGVYLFTYASSGLQLYMILTALGSLIWSLSESRTRSPNEVSAWSVFNPGYEPIPGTLDAEQIDREIRRGRQL